MEAQSLADIKSYALSDGDINEILEPDTFIFSYPYLERVRHIDSVFDPYGRSMMLYLTEDRNTGHWVCMIKKGNEIEFFDPYGEKPDDQLKWVAGAKRMELDQDRPLLSKLLRESGYKVVYNKYPFQKDKDDINTCGRHCVSRLLFKDLSLPEYVKMIQRSGMSPDEFVSRLTFPTLRK